SDIYTLGILIYEMITGRTPFAEFQTPTAILAAVLTHAPAPLSTYVDVPRALDHIVARCLERELVNRFGEIGELGDALAAVAAVGAEDPTRWSGTGTAMPEVTTVPTTTSGFEEDASLTSDATRIDVRVTNSSEPVLDARGPRGRPAPPHRALPPPIPPRAPAPLGTPTSLPPPVSVRAIHARGSQHAIDERAARGPRPEGRASQPMIDVAAWHRQRTPEPAPQGPAPYGYFQRHADATPAGISYEVLSARNRARMMHRIIWWTVLFLLSTVITLLATR
ncbi:MAG: hypothetical protein ABIY55_31190, partial [Kofleriaceae bacterium]